MDETVMRQLTALVDRVARVEAKLDLSLQLLESASTSISEISERLTRVESSTKSAHKRLDDVEAKRREDIESARWWIALGVTAAGVISGIIATYMGR
jgi:exonuclease VII small subunit